MKPVPPGPFSQKAARGLQVESCLSTQPRQGSLLMSLNPGSRSSWPSWVFSCLQEALPLALPSSLVSSLGENELPQLPAGPHLRSPSLPGKALCCHLTRYLPMRLTISFYSNSAPLTTQLPPAECLPNAKCCVYNLYILSYY